MEAGQPLLELESAALGEAESHYLETEASLRLARKAFERQATLRDEGISSEKEFLTARQEFEAAGIRAQASADRLRRLGLSNPGDRGAREGGPVGCAQGRLVLRAPAAGTILEMHAVPGEAVRPDQSVFTIGDLSQLWVLADVYEGQVQKVLSHEGHGDMRATVTSKAFPDEVFPATVDFVGPLDGREDPHAQGPGRREEPEGQAPGRDVRERAALPAVRRGGARRPAGGAALRRGALLRLRPPPRRVLGAAPGRDGTRRPATRWR